MDTRILLEEIYYLSTGLEFNRGFVFIRGNRIDDVGEQVSPEHILSELHYNFEGKAIVVHGFSTAISPSLYPFRGLNVNDVSIDLTVFTDNEIKGFIKASLYELLMNGVTLPVIYEHNNSRVIKLTIEVAKSLKIPMVIASKSSILETYTDSIDKKLIYAIDIEKQEFIEKLCIDKITPECSTLLLRNTMNLNAIMANYMMRVKSNYYNAINVLIKPYQIIGIDKGVIEKGARSHIVVYDARRPLKAPLIKSSPSVILKRGYLPDLVIIDGDVVVEQGIVYIIDENEVRSILDKVSEKW